jgi:hypothetical protein
MSVTPEIIERIEQPYVAIRARVTMQGWASSASASERYSAGSRRVIWRP